MNSLSANSNSTFKSKLNDRETIKENVFNLVSLQTTPAHYNNSSTTPNQDPVQTHVVAYATSSCLTQLPKSNSTSVFEK